MLLIGLHHLPVVSIPLLLPLNSSMISLHLPPLLPFLTCMIIRGNHHHHHHVLFKRMTFKSSFKYIFSDLRLSGRLFRSNGSIYETDCWVQAMRWILIPKIDSRPNEHVNPCCLLSTFLRRKIGLYNSTLTPLHHVWNTSSWFLEGFYPTIVYCPEFPGIIFYLYLSNAISIKVSFYYPFFNVKKIYLTLNRIFERDIKKISLLLTH